MKEADVKIALARRHKKDYYITAVKTGPTWNSKKGELGILDAWAMKKSWDNLNFIGYEIKVSRSDFKGDRKWRKYLPFCHNFYFACPKDLIKQDELPDGIGLIYVSNSGKTREEKPAKRMNNDPDVAFLMGILMNKLDSDRLPFFDDRRQMLQAWADGRASDKTQAYRLKGKIFWSLKRYADQISLVSRQNEQLRKILQEIGFDESTIYTPTLGVADRTRLERYRKPAMENTVQGSLFDPCE